MEREEKNGVRKGNGKRKINRGGKRSKNKRDKGVRRKRHTTPSLIRGGQGELDQPDYRTTS